MALKAAGVLALPDLACLGTVSKVSNSYLSSSGVYQVIPIEVKAKFAGKDTVFFLVYEPRWFDKAFDATVLLDEGKAGQTKYGMYSRTVNGEARPSVLVSILGEAFEAFAAEFEKISGEPTPKQVEEIFRRHAVGRDVLYVLTQRKDEDKKLMEQYNVKNFVPQTTEAIVDLQEQAANSKRKTPLKLTWDEE